MNGNSNSNRSNETKIQAMIPSGFPYYRNQMMLWFLGLTIVYLVTLGVFDSVIKPVLQLPPSDPMYCPNDEGHECWRGDLFAFEVASGVTLIWSGIVGFFTWHMSDMDNSIPMTPEGRLFGYLPQAHILTAVGTTFQAFDFFISLFIEEQCTPLMLCHHLMAATVAWYGLNNQYFHYYGGKEKMGNANAPNNKQRLDSHKFLCYLSFFLIYRHHQQRNLVFFLGCSEISTIPLLFIDVARFFPPVPGSKYDLFIGAICNPLFAITFTYYRVIAWWKVSRQLFEDCLFVLRTGKAHKLRPNRNHVLYVMMFCNILLGIMQLYWFRFILFAIIKVVGIDVPELEYS